MSTYIVQVKNMKDLSDIKKLGLVIYESPILNVIGIEMTENNLSQLNKLNNVENVRPQAIGALC